MLRKTILALLLLLALPAGVVAQERILLFRSDVKVERNGDLDVTETIRVQAEGQEIRRGILRDFPTTYRRRDGARVVVGFEVRSVTRDGAAENFVTERLSNGVRIRIGSADRVLNRGPHEYVISYRTTRQIGFFPDFDELYWNATGTGWTFAIEVAEARITLPQNVRFRQSAFYTGPQDARGQDARVVEQTPGQILFRTTRQLSPHNGLTVAAAWDKGVIAPPSAADQAGWLLSDHLPHTIGAAGLLALLSYYLLVWWRVGRDPPAGTIIPLFAPPDGMSAASTRYVRLMKFDNRCFTAAIVELGVNGYLKLNDNGESTTIERRSGTKAIPAAERDAWKELFEARSTLKLEQANHQILSAASSELESGLTAAYYGRLFHTNHLWSVLGLLAAVALCFAVGVAADFTYGDQQGVPMIAGTLIAMIGAAMAAAMLSSWMSGATPILNPTLLGIIVALVFAAGVFLVRTFGNWVDTLAMIPPLIAAGLATLAFYLLKAPTREGRKVMDGIEGLRQYLGVAEEDRLQFLNPPEKTPEVFEKFLPYAIALDVENAWAKRFAAVLAAAAAAGAASTWYAGSGHYYSGDPVGLAQRVGDSLSSTIASASTAPGSSSSGSSGGGSSGGGGGGGGGSGW